MGQIAGGSAAAGGGAAEGGGAAVRDNVAAQRFELALDGGLAFIDYRRSGDTLSLNHAEVPAALNGRGIGARLVAGTLDLIRSRGERMIPRCSFVAHFVERHPQYADLRDISRR